MPDCITTDRISKTFGRVRAVRDISLHVGEGEIYGFLGLNGAGKTTTIRMLLGMIRRHPERRTFTDRRRVRRITISGTGSAISSRYLIHIPT